MASLDDKDIEDVLDMLQWDDRAQAKPSIFVDSDDDSEIMMHSSDSISEVQEELLSTDLSPNAEIVAAEDPQLDLELSELFEEISRLKQQQESESFQLPVPTRSTVQMGSVQLSYAELLKWTESARAASEIQDEEESMKAMPDDEKGE